MMFFYNEQDPYTQLHLYKVYKTIRQHQKDTNADIPDFEIPFRKPQ